MNYLKALALLSVSALCLSASYSITTTSKHLNVTLMRLNDEIEEAHRLTLEAGLTVMEARKASVMETEYLDTWNRQLTQTLQAAQTSIASINSVSSAAVSTLNTTQQTVASLQAPIASANQTLTAATASISHLDALIQDPAITATIAHTDATMGHVEATSADVQQEVYKYTHPGIWARIKGALLDVAHVFNPL